MADKVEIEIVHGEIVEIKKGDVIAITVTVPLSEESVAKLSRAVSEKLPGCEILILTEDTKLSILRGVDPIPETL